jgi:hypothetical protein
VHARTLLVNLPEPASAAAEMMRLARPGGCVASMEPDTEHALCYPPCPAFDRLCEIFTVVFRRNGADPWIGRRVPELFRQAGLEEVAVEARVQSYPRGNSRRTIRVDLVRAMRPQVLEMGLVSAAELDELDAAARAPHRPPRGSDVRPDLPHLGPQTGPCPAPVLTNRVSTVAVLNDFAETLGHRHAWIEQMLILGKLHLRAVLIIRKFSGG